MKPAARGALASVVGALLCLHASSGSGQTPAFSSPGPGTVLTAGSQELVAWSLDARRARGFGEMELLLSIDGGRTFPIRVTRDLDPVTRSLAWRVPALPAPRARLALRAGDGGEPDAEEIRLVSEEFAIEADPVAALEPVMAVRGEWRTGEALDVGSAGHPCDPRSLADTSDTIGMLPALPPAAAPKLPLASKLDERGSDRFEIVAPLTAPPLRLPLSRVPAAVPMRE